MKKNIHGYTVLFHIAVLYIQVNRHFIERKTLVETMKRKRKILSSFEIKDDH